MNNNIGINKKDRPGWLFGKMPLSVGQNKALTYMMCTVIAGTFLAMVAMILYYAVAFAAAKEGSSAYDMLLGIFSDFVYIMNTSLEDSPYICEQSSYPPLAIFILYPFALICRARFAEYADKTFTLDELTGKMVQTPEFWVAIVLFFLISTVLILLLLIKLFSFDKKAALTVSVTVPACAPFVFAIMRGNTIYFALIFTLFFLAFKDSKSRLLRELSLISLALAGAIKIYPLFFGVFLLNKKKIFASCRVAVYFFAILISSFFLLKSGLSDFDVFVGNLGSFMSNDVRLLAGNNLSISSLIYRFVYIFSPMAANSGATNTVTLAVIGIAFLISAFCATVTRSELSRYIICLAMVVLVPSVSYFYILIFAILPMLELIRKWDEISKRKRTVYAILFMFLMLMPFQPPQQYVFHSLTVIAMLIWECRETAVEIRR